MLDGIDRVRRSTTLVALTGAAVEIKWRRIPKAGQKVVRQDPLLSQTIGFEMVFGEIAGLHARPPSVLLSPVNSCVTSDLFLGESEIDRAGESPEQDADNG